MTTPVDPPALETLPGVDLGPVLELLGDDRALLGQLLAGFVEDFAGIAEEARRALAAGETGALARRLHSLKGAAANLGLAALAEDAARLEQAVKAGQPGGERLALLNHTFATLLPALRHAAANMAEG